MTEEEVARIVIDTSGYRALGLVGNPFPVELGSGETPSVSAEILSEANALLVAIDRMAGQEKPRPIWVEKTEEVPSYYHLRAVSEVERVLATDRAANVLHAYIQLFMMKQGRVRSSLAMAAERLAFTEFQKTMAAFIDSVLAAPDPELPSFQALDVGVLETFAERFALDPEAVAVECFGDDSIERRPEFAADYDGRVVAQPADVEAEQSSDIELDESIGDAPGAAVIALEQETQHAVDPILQVTDYLIDYTREHVSPVIARALRQHRERGLVATITELQVTKAPTKTLHAVARMARSRFRKLVLLYDGFESWFQVDDEIRVKILKAFSDMRWTLDQDAVLVFLVETDAAPELEEQFSSGTRLFWRFEGVAAAQQAGDTLDRDSVERWLKSAALDESKAPKLEDRTLAALLEEAPGAAAFIAAAAAAVESAAGRGAVTLDDESLAAGRAVLEGRV